MRGRATGEIDRAGHPDYRLQRVYRYPQDGRFIAADGLVRSALVVKVASVPVKHNDRRR
ncbi:hypothetical protein CCP3SC15_4350005 [Gammaproteobacteria bacterium]